jgi:hypothetical protein
MKRLEKARTKAERRAQKKLTKDDPQAPEEELMVLTAPLNMDEEFGMFTELEPL